MKDAAAKASAPARDAFREGSAYGFKAGGGGTPSGASGGSSARGRSSSSAEPQWASRLRRREQMTRAGTVASQSIREGDRGAASEGPDLNPDT